MKKIFIICLLVFKVSYVLAMEVEDYYLDCQYESKADLTPIGGLELDGEVEPEYGSFSYVGKHAKEVGGHKTNTMLGVEIKNIIDPPHEVLMNSTCLEDRSGFNGDVLFTGCEYRTTWQNEFSNDETLIVSSELYFFEFNNSFSNKPIIQSLRKNENAKQNDLSFLEAITVRNEYFDWNDATPKEVFYGNCTIIDGDF
tara:strand:- start:1316 stop:1909 length:594 start_codon:yes stop_codon:yes gene_type:complete